MYTDKEKRIFAFYLEDGNAEDDNVRYADPLAVRRELLRHTGGMLNDLLDKDQLAYEQAVSGEQVQPAVVADGADAEGRVVDAVRSAFGLTPIDPNTGEGSTDEYCKALLKEFLVYLEKKSPSTVTSLTSAPPTDSTPTESQPTTSSSDCGCN